MREFKLAVDWGMGWPLNDIMSIESKPDWDSVITPELKKRMFAWGKYFNDHADLESGSFLSEEKRKWFDLEGVHILNDLNDQAGHLYKFRLELWF